MITLLPSKLWIEGNCDYCNDPIGVGNYVGLSGYELVSKPKGRIVKVGGPFIPCKKCSYILGLPTVDQARILTIHKWAAIKFGTDPKIISVEIV